MSEDGADLGITPGRALKTILGNEESPKKGDGMTPTEMKQWLLDAPDDPQSYDDGARSAGKIVLHYLLLHPEDARLPADAKWKWPNGYDQPHVVVEEGIYDNPRTDRFHVGMGSQRCEICARLAACAEPRNRHNRRISYDLCRLLLSVLQEGPTIRRRRLSRLSRATPNQEN